MPRPSRYSPEVRERAVRMVREHGAEHASQWPRSHPSPANWDARQRRVHSLSAHTELMTKPPDAPDMPRAR